MSAKRGAQRGGSLIEAMIAMLVLSLGIMGMAATQTRTLITARTTELRAVAIRAAEDLQDRMQANSEIRLELSTTNPYLTSWGDAPPPDTDCQTRPCDGIRLAAFDVAQWKSALALALPGGDALVFSSDKDPMQFGVLVAWTEATARNESIANEDDSALFAQAVAVRDAQGETGTGVAGKECPERHVCHLFYFRP